MWKSMFTQSPLKGFLGSHRTVTLSTVIRSSLMMIILTHYHVNIVTTV